MPGTCEYAYTRVTSDHLSSFSHFNDGLSALSGVASDCSLCGAVFCGAPCLTVVLWWRRCSRIKHLHSVLFKSFKVCYCDYIDCEICVYTALLKRDFQTIKPDYVTRRIHKLFRVSHNNVPAVADLMKQNCNVSDKPVYMRTNCTSHEALKEWFYSFR